MRITGKKTFLLALGLLFLFNWSTIEAGEKSSVILKAMEEEIARSMKVLGEKATPPPYFISYRITENTDNRITAANGALQNSYSTKKRLLDVDVRVGDYALDSSHRLRGRRFRFNFLPPHPMSLDDDPDAIKSVLWLQTDKKYREAAKQLIEVKANKGVSVEEEDKSADFSKEKPGRYTGKIHSVSPDVPAWKTRVKEYSHIADKHPEIHMSRVMLRAEAENKYFASSEGSALQHGRTHWRLSLMLRTKADDGMELFKSKNYDARTLDNLPDDKTVRADLERLIKDLRALRKAPVMEPYTGPAILSGDAAAVFFHEIFGHRIEGHRQKDENFAQTFTKKINEEILPNFLTVQDNPALEQFKGVDLNGHYLYDDEGVKGQPVAVVEKGILKNFLMSRSPVKGFTLSNGHGRAQAGRAVVSRQGNLIIEPAKSLTDKELRQKLLEECKTQGKPYGLYFDDVVGGFTFTGRFLPQSFNVTPVSVYRIYVDGRPDELVRGVDLIGTPLTSFSKILACGETYGVFNGYCGAESGMVPASAICPRLLTGQIEVQKKVKASDKPPVLAKPAGKDADKPGAGKDIVFKAMADEMDRSIKSLKLENMEKPYFLEYTVTDYRGWTITAGFGAPVNSEERIQRLLKAGLRVGNYDLDNSAFLDQKSMFASMSPAQLITIENNYNALRHAIWLNTDKKYKATLEQLAAKQAHMKSEVQEDPIPDFSKEEKLEKTVPPKPAAVDRATCEAMVEKLSAVFKKFPAIHASKVEFRFVDNYHHYLNSEGSRAGYPESWLELVAHASTRAADGMILKHFVPFYAVSIEGLPPEKELTGKIAKMAEELTALAKAPVLDEYIGPVLFAGQASTELFSQLMASHFSGERPPMSNMGQISQLISSSKLVSRLNRRVLPSFLSVTDDPTRSVFNKQPLIGAYPVDAEGVAAQAVPLVEKGKLKSLLMSRRPRKNMLRSNGHCRAPVMGKAGVQVGNLFIDALEKKSDKQMKEELLQLCRDQELPFGLMIRTVDNPSITGKEITMASIMAMRSPGGPKLTAPVMMYKVYAKDGREELVRGLAFNEISLNQLRDITAAGGTPYVNNRLFAGSSGFSLFGRFMPRRDAFRMIPGAVIAPGVLFEEIELKKNSDSLKKPPILPHPYFVKK